MHPFGRVCALRVCLYCCALSSWGVSLHSAVGLYEVCCIFCKDGDAHSSNSHGCNQAWCCQLYEFAWSVQSTLSVSGQFCTYDLAEACLIMFVLSLNVAELTSTK